MENPLRGEKMADSHDPDTPQTGKKAGFSLGRIIPLALLAAQGVVDAAFMTPPVFRSAAGGQCCWRGAPVVRKSGGNSKSA